MSQWGDHIEFLVSTAEETGVVPKSLEQAPSLEPHLDYYYKQYQALARSRPYTQGCALPIPVSEILAHCRLHRLSATDGVELCEYVHLFDRVWLEIKGKKDEAEAKARATTSK